MSEKIQINLIDISQAAAKNLGQEVYSDPYFTRRNGETNVPTETKVNYLIDYIDELKMGVAYLKIHFYDADTVELFADSSAIETNSKGTFVKAKDGDTVFWLPGRIIARDYLDNGNIVKENQIETTQSDENGFHLNIPGDKNLTVELPIVFAIEGGDEFITQIVSTEPLEEQATKLDQLFNYSQPGDVWDYLIAGNIYRLMAYISDFKSNLSWPCQQTANSLYSYLVYLYELTGKQVYKFFYDLVAYSVMLNLDNQGRWRHGLWAPPIMETHVRFHVSGVCMLASYYKKTNRNIFLSKAQKAMDYIITLADDMEDDALWFVHDSLEQKNMWDKYRYKNDFDSNAFGKSRHNTLCLNTHIWTILGFCRLKEVSSDERYDCHINKGMAILEKVFDAKPAQGIYRLVYWLRDLLINSHAKGAGRIARELKRRYEKMLHGWILPYMKKRFPRVNMPNGFIERDLTHSRISDIYHLATLDDLLMLYAYLPSQWLEDAIRKSMVYTHTSGFVKYYAQHGPVANIFIEMLLLYSSMIDESYLKLIPQYIAFLEELGIAASSDSLSNMLIISDEIQIRTDNERLKCFTTKHCKNFMALIVNPDDKPQKAKIEINSLTKQKINLKIVDSNNKDISLDYNVEIPANGFVKFTKA